jgi:hypothetical protein
MIDLCEKTIDSANVTLGFCELLDQQLLEMRVVFEEYLTMELGGSNA